ncbi:MAG: SAM-dependent methyltransferase, partial [Alphaproteobacteria bacterium]|nr:SAM-dependent methyltransferase [Alphaproteobacteria bacterium]
MRGVFQHDVMPHASQDDEARENFCRNLSVHLETVVRPKLRGVYEREVGPALAETLGRAPN